jgi:hypothetical protein
MSTLCAYDSGHLDFNYGSARGGGTGYYSTTCIKLGVFSYIMTVKALYMSSE